MMAPDVGTIARALAALAENADALEVELNAADARLGDGDTGTMLARMIRAMAETPLDAVAPGPGPALIALARAGATTTGSSLGTLIVSGLIAMGKACGDSPADAAPPFAELLETAAASMRQRGGSEPGDKTVLDALDRLALGLAAPGAGKAEATMATQSALAEFRDKPCRLGRARMFAERSIGLDDPGMLALHRVVEIVTR